jgi:hypothetical protein
MAANTITQAKLANFQRTVRGAIKVGASGAVSVPSTDPIHLLLDRLDCIRQTRPNRWTARCPAHDDRSPSLAITEAEDGTVLVKCWAGCSAEAIVGAVGLELKDLFPPRFDFQATNKGKAPRYSASEVVKTLMTESTILLLGYRALQRGEALNLHDQARVELAINVIENCSEVAR